MVRIRSIIFSICSLVASITLIWYVYADEWSTMQSGIKACHSRWVALAALLHLTNHALRSYRWRLLLRAQGASISFRESYLAEMSGFFVNAMGGRIGEIARCEVLKRRNGISRSRALATVLVERVVDCCFFIGLLLVSLVLYFRPVLGTLRQLKQVVLTKVHLSTSSYLIAVLLLVAALLLLFNISWDRRIKSFLSALREALRISRKAAWRPFWVLTALIWALYFGLEYVSFFAIDATADLISHHGIRPAIYTFIALNISHLIPTSNGAGAYHTFVIVMLVTNFPIDTHPVKLYALVTHAIQTFNALIPGGCCFLISLLLKRPRPSGALRQ